jgi:hypothetical protein
MLPFLSSRGWMGWGLYAFQLALALLFLYSAMPKFSDLTSFYLFVRGMSPVSMDFLIQMTAYFLPSLEVVLAGALAVRRYELAALGLLFLLVLFYILILTRAYVLGLKVPCNYFATEISASYGIPRDVILVSLLGARWCESK